MDRFNYTGVCWLGNEGGGGVVRGRAKIVDNAVFGAAKKKKKQ